MPKRKKSRDLDVNLPGTLSDQFIGDLLSLVADDGGFKARYLREEILSKYSDPTTTPADVRRDNAIRKWLHVESQNAQTNVRLYYNEVDFGWINSLSLMAEVRSLIARILGPVIYPSVLSGGCHTNGASTRVKRSPIAAQEKLTGAAEISLSAVDHWDACFQNTLLSSQDMQLQESSCLFTVPKKSDIDRVACKEPENNMLLQKSVGNHIRRRLLRYGIDLNDQTVNQELARVAVREKLATIDLSSASDTITIQLVTNLLPFEWWSLLDDLRVKSTLIGEDKQFHELAMFSSMGNGFTFELESLLFYAITRVVCWKSGIKGRISVYGDDIIAPARVVKRLRRVFSYLGFTMNAKKTHSTGLFRESCGKHYYGGFDVTPFYIRRRVDTLPDLISLLNKFLEWDGRGWGFLQTPEAISFHRKWSAYVPTILHGGLDPEDPTSLVTGDVPRHRLIQKTRKKQPVELERSRYLLWHLTQDSANSLNALYGIDPVHQEKEKNKTFFASSVRSNKAELLSYLDTENLGVEIDPRVETGYKTTPIKAYGARTTWIPYFLTRKD